MRVAKSLWSQSEIGVGSVCDESPGRKAAERRSGGVVGIGLKVDGAASGGGTKLHDPVLLPRPLVGEEDLNLDGVAGGEGAQVDGYKATTTAEVDFIEQDLESCVTRRSACKLAYRYSGSWKEVSGREWNSVNGDIRGTAVVSDEQGSIRANVGDSGNAGSGAP